MRCTGRGSRTEDGCGCRSDSEAGFDKHGYSLFCSLLKKGRAVEGTARSRSRRFERALPHKRRSAGTEKPSTPKYTAGGRAGILNSVRYRAIQLQLGARQGDNKVFVAEQITARARSKLHGDSSGTRSPRLCRAADRRVSATGRRPGGGGRSTYCGWARSASCSKAPSSVSRYATHGGKTPSEDP
jgi:hypothetical protein